MVAAAARASSKGGPEKAGTPESGKRRGPPASAAPNPTWGRLATRVQPKLTVSAPDDPSEREADRIADEVMRMPDASGPVPAPLPVGGSFVQRKCAACEREEEASSFEAYLATSRSQGAPLPAPTRAHFESRFGYDFGGVRVHTDAAAADAASRIHAHAFTSGSNIHFADGRFRPGTADGDRLLAHELAHTIQQTGGDPARTDHTTRIDRWPSASDVLGSIEDTIDSARDSASGAIDSARQVVGGAIDDAREAVSDAADTVVEKGREVVASAEQDLADLRDRAEGLAREGLDWLESEAGAAARALVHAFGGVITVTEEGLVITLPRTCPIEALQDSFDLPGLDESLMAPVFGFDLGPLLITGEIGIAGHLAPKAQVQLGPICLDGVRIVINPVTSRYSISGSVSATAAVSLAAEARAGLRGELHARGVIPVGDIPVPVDISLIGVEGGIAGLVRGTGATTIRIGGGLSYGGGAINLTNRQQLTVGLAADAFLGAYAQLDILGENVCRIYWQPLEWHGDIAGSLGLNLGMTIVPGSRPSVFPYASPPTFSQVPFSQFPLVLSRKGFSDACPIKDKLCDVLRELHLLPSQNGGKWNWGGPYGPGFRLPGPMDVYQRNPGIPSGALCRGACGVDCTRCLQVPSYPYHDPVTGQDWIYTNFEDCNTNDGCREHDAAFDWAAAVHGEKGPLAIVMPWHMAANVECTCNNLTGNCIAWIVGLPPYDGKMYFADSAALATGGGGATPTPTTGSCRADYPGAPACPVNVDDRDEVLAAWGALHGIEHFRACHLVESHEAQSWIPCRGPGNLWECAATDTVSGRPVIVQVFECFCCDARDQKSSTWNTPGVVLRGLPEDVACELCERGVVDPDACAAWLQERSAAVPSLTRSAWCRAKRAIDDGQCDNALSIILAALSAAGQINMSLADWAFIGRSDQGVAQTIFTWVLDPVTQERRAHAPVRVEIYTPACSDVGWLFSSMMHEYQHVLQVLHGAPAREFDAKGNQRPEFVARDEVEAYLWEIEHAEGSGVINNRDQMRSNGEMLRRMYLAMTPPLQAQYHDRYEAAERKVLDVLAGRPRMSYEEARRIVQESSAQIAALLQHRPGNEASVDAEIERVRRRRADAMVVVALVENPQIQVVRAGDPGTYRVPTVDADGRVRYLYGGIQVAWHMGQASPSAFSLGQGLGAGGDMAVAGTAVQGQVQPFPPDIDFDEHIHVVANTREDAGRLAAQRIVDGIRRISGGPVPGRTDIEFRHLLTFPRGRRPDGRPRKGIRMGLGQVLGGGAVGRLGHAIAELGGGNINTFWRGRIVDTDGTERFTTVTRVIFVTATDRSGRTLLTASSSDDFNLAFIEDPGSISTTSLANFSWQMCCDAVRRADSGDWLKAAKRAYNYFSTTGDMTHMHELEPVFRRSEAQAEQYATVVDGIENALVSRDMKVAQPRTRILTVSEAREQVQQAADVLERTLPDGARISAELHLLATRLRARNARGQLAQDDALAAQFEHMSEYIRNQISMGLQTSVQPVIDSAIRPVCDTPDVHRRNACQKR